MQLQVNLDVMVNEVNYLDQERPDLAGIVLHKIALPRNYLAEAKAAVDQTYMLLHRAVQSPKSSQESLLQSHLLTTSKSRALILEVLPSRKVRIGP